MAITKISAAMADLDGSVTINESSADANFRVESDGNSKAISILGDKYGLGVGRDPESAYNGYTSIELGQQATLIANDAGDDLGLKVNTYLDSGGNWKRKETGVAASFDMDGDQIKFFTAASGSADANITFAQKLRIDNDGIKFGTDTAAANALSDYEQGAWVPDAHQGTASFTTVHSATYVKIGNMCYCQAYLVFPASSDSGYAAMSLPFNAANITNAHWGGPIVLANHGLDFTSCMTFANSHDVFFRNYKTGVVATRAEMSGKYMIVVTTFQTT